MIFCFCQINTFTRAIQDYTAASERLCRDNIPQCRNKKAAFLNQLVDQHVLKHRCQTSCNDLLSKRSFQNASSNKTPNQYTQLQAYVMGHYLHNFHWKTTTFQVTASLALRASHRYNVILRELKSNASYSPNLSVRMPFIPLTYHLTCRWQAQARRLFARTAVVHLVATISVMGNLIPI